jgi:hypothetical protein
MGKIPANLGMLVIKRLKKLESIDGRPDYWTNCQRAPEAARPSTRAGVCLHYSRRTGDSYANWIKHLIPPPGKQS